MILKIADVKDPILRAKAKRVEAVDKRIQKLISDMRETLLAQDDPEGVGLAAPLVGRSLQIFLMDYKKTTDIIINPQVLSKSETPKSTKKAETGKPLEGCLSLPHYYGPIARTNKIKIKYINESGDPIVKEFRGFPAQIVEHEIDHLNGILFIDRIIEQKAPLYKFQGDHWEEVELV
jgi:peptide deformylase